MDIPSIDLALETLDEDMSDTSSFSDAPVSVMGVDEDFVSSPDAEISPVRGFGGPGLSSRFVYDGDDENNENDKDEESDYETAVSPRTHRHSHASPKKDFSYVEILPAEVSGYILGFSSGNSSLTDLQLLEKVAVFLTDSDLYSLCLAGRLLCNKLMPENSGIWKTRFLSRYDFPSIDGPFEFCAGYQLRRFVLRNFAECGNGGPQAQVGMEVLRDMVLGTVHPILVAVRVDLE